MNKLIFLPFLLLVGCASAQKHTIEKLWETDAIIAVPESVLPDVKHNVLFVSLVDGAPWEADGKGGVGKLSMDGKVYDSVFVTGLNAPKGLAKFGDKLYVADISEVVVIDSKSGKIENRISVPGASGLNDVTVDDKGIVYVSDTRTGNVWQIQNEKPALYLEHLTGVNGLKAIGQDLFIGAGKNFVMADKNKKITTIAELPQPIDGLEPVGNGDFILSSWIGFIYYVTKSGRVETLLDSTNEKMNTADIGYDPSKRIIYVPAFFAKKVVAFHLN